MNPQPEAAIIGIKLGTLVAGFAGGVVSLSFLRNLSNSQSVLAVFTGVACAVYVTPVVMHYIFPSQFDTPLEKGVAFLLGLTAMNIIPGFIKLSEAFKNNPVKFIDRNRGEE